ncbi:hypothetical protein [Kitasatospora kifunensis]|uniref:Transposase n=1 Tax=Kitasatospora kifunensis TaxID=58351 RepID=A0A7W7RBZ5_KITKI|nr:hypothetical protein [Kitasatospora kifunensis]MBB4928601.1 hypothetical protein [Kitasatospora kifunensis]
MRGVPYLPRGSGLAARTQDLRQAVFAAWQSGVACEVSAADTGLDTSTVERWVALADLRRT